VTPLYYEDELMDRINGELEFLDDIYLTINRELCMLLSENEKLDTDVITRWTEAGLSLFENVVVQFENFLSYTPDDFKAHWGDKTPAYMINRESNGKENIYCRYQVQVKMRWAVEMIEFLCRLGVSETSATECRFESLVRRLVTFSARHISNFSIVNLGVYVDLCMKMYCFRLNNYGAAFPLKLDKSDCADVLIECGADPSAVDELGNSALHTLLNLIKLLEEDASWYELPDDDASYSFVKFMFPELRVYVQKLLDAGAHVDSKNRHGRIAYEIAEAVFEKKFKEFPYVRLECLAARVLVKSRYPPQLIPAHLISFVSMH